MRVRTSPGRRAVGGFVLAIFALAFAVSLSGVASARSELGDGCDPNEPIACIPLPEQEGLTGPSTQIAPPLPPGAPCAPINVQAPATPDAQIATPLPPGCPVPSLITRLNRANVLWAQAVRTHDTSALSQAWAGPALDGVVAYVEELRRASQYVAPELRDIRITSLSTDGTHAQITTVETWYQELRWWPNGEVISRDLARAGNLYEFERFNDGWKVVRNEVRPADAPVPPAPWPTPVPPTPPCIAIFPPPPGCEIPGANVSVTTDREVYTPGQPVVVTVTNTGNTALTGGGGYRCGLVEIGYAPDGGDWYIPAPGGAEICPAIAMVLQPGESRTETFTFNDLGQYRASVRLSVEGSQDGQVVVASDPFTVAVF